jgi:hypothetical protein
MSIRSSSSGSILIYVLWILVVISVLAFQLASASRVLTVNQSAFANQLKKQMQIESAVQFAMFKIISNEWNNKPYELYLNNQKINIRIFNELGFVSIYALNNETLRNIFEFVSLDEITIEELEKAIVKDERPQRFNSFSELRRFSEINDEVIKQLIPLVSIYHEDPVNPRYSPVDVLTQFHRVDQFRVQELKETTDENEASQLRNEIIESLFVQENEFSDNLSAYFRVHIEIDGYLHRAFLKYNRQQKKYIVVMIDSSEIISNENAS